VIDHEHFVVWRQRLSQREADLAAADDDDAHAQVLILAGCVPVPRLPAAILQNCRAGISR
jgi:hypothetical protein